MKYRIRLNCGRQLVAEFDEVTERNNFTHASKRVAECLFGNQNADNASSFVVYEDGTVAEHSPFFYAEKY